MPIPAEPRPIRRLWAAAALALAACGSMHPLERELVQGVQATRGQLLLVHPADAGSVTACAFSADGREVATGCADGSLRVWDARDGALRLYRPGSGAAVVRCGVGDPDGLVWMQAADGSVRWWTLGGADAGPQPAPPAAAAGAVAGDLLARAHHSGAVRAACLDATRARLLTASVDGTARVTWL